MEFREEIYNTRGFSSFLQYRQDRRFCDIALKCQDKTLHAHKIVIASQSPYFHEKLAGSDDVAVVDIPKHISSSTVESVLDFMYTGSIAIDSFNYRDLMIIQKLFEIPDLSEMLYRTLRKFIIPQNIRHFIKSYPDFTNITSLKEHFDHVFLHSFEDISKDLLSVGPELLNVISLLGRAELNLKEEESVHAFLDSWLSLNSLEITTTDIKEVMKLVWWQDLNTQYLSSIYFNDTSTTAEVQKPLAYNTLQQKSNGNKDESKYQRAGQYKRAMFAVASYEGSHIWELLRADTNDEEWFDLGECPLMNTEKATCCFLEGWLYVLGNNGDLLRYSVYIKKWEECRKTPYSIVRSHVMCRSANQLLVVGGDHSTGRSVIRYDQVEDTWYTCSTLPRFCDRFSGTSVRDTLYIVGQSQGEDIIVQSYNGENNTWDVIEEPDRGPYDVPISATSNNDMVYILGGQAPTENRPEEGSILFRFNPSFENATVLHPLPTCCINAKLVSVQDKVYSIGGIEKGVVLDTINKYCPLSDSWSVLEWKFPWHTKRYSVTTHS